MHEKIVLITVLGIVGGR